MPLTQPNLMNLMGVSEHILLRATVSVSICFLVAVATDNEDAHEFYL